MRYLGNHGGWCELATACLRHAVKSGDTDCIYGELFSVLCGLANKDENEVIVEIKYAERMKELYGDKWYRRSKK